MTFIKGHSQYKHREGCACFVCNPVKSKPPPAHKNNCACFRCSPVSRSSGWNKGKKTPLEVRRKITLSLQGRKCGDETKSKISEALMGKKFSEERLKKARIVYKTRNNWNKGKHWPEEIRRKISEAKKGKMPNLPEGHLRKMSLKGALTLQHLKRPTSIEKKVYDYLLLKGILFEKQKLIKEKFIVDAYIPSLNLIIEADGSYWHSLEKTVKKDKAENAYLKACGYNLIRLSEEEIMSGSFVERLVL